MCRLKKTVAEISLLLMECWNETSIKDLSWLKEISAILEKELSYQSIDFVKISKFSSRRSSNIIISRNYSKKQIGAIACWLEKEEFENSPIYFQKSDSPSLVELFNRYEAKSLIIFPLFLHKSPEGALFLYSNKTSNSLQDDEKIIFNFILVRLKEYFRCDNYKKLLQKRSELLSSIASDIQKRFEFAAIASEMLIYDWNLIEKKVIRFKKGNNKIWGYSSSKFNKSLFWNKLIHPQDFVEATAKLKAQLDNRDANFVTCRYRFKKSNGEYAFVQDKGYIIRNKEDIAIRIVGGVSDISDLVQKESELKVANERFSLAMKASNEMIYDWQVQKNEVTRSTSFQKIYGEKNDQGSLDQWFNKICKDDTERIKTSFFEALNNKRVQIWKQDYAFLNNNNEKTFVTDRCYILRYPSGKPKRIVGAVLDVTESKNMLEEIRNKNEILKDISWSQSHLVRAPIVRMHGILNSLDDPELDFWRDDNLFKIFKDSVIELDEEIRRIAQKMEDL